MQWRAAGDGFFCLAMQSALARGGKKLATAVAGR